MNERKLIIIAGGSASGKTTVSKKIAQEFEKSSVAYLRMDNYYKDLSYLNSEQRKKVNFDHPSEVDFELLLNHLKQLLNGQAVNQPIYDFKNNNRSKEVKIIIPAKVIILDGIFALENSEIRNLANIKVFVDTESDIRLIRRINRDTKLRARNLDDIMNKYLLNVKPMHQLFVEPTKKYANIIIPYSYHNNVAIDIIVTKIKHLLIR